MPLSGSDYPFADVDLPWLPDSIQAWLHDLTYNEVHAAGLGLVGFLVGAAIHLGFRAEAGAFTVAVVTLAFGLRKAPNDAPIAQRLIRHEPWYFLTVYIVTAAISAWTLPVVL